MIPIELGKTDLNEIEEAQRPFVVQSQMNNLVNQLNIALQSISSSDISMDDGVTLNDYLKSRDL